LLGVFALKSSAFGCQAVLHYSNTPALRKAVVPDAARPLAFLIVKNLFSGEENPKQIQNLQKPPPNGWAAFSGGFNFGL
jgi:hypothetical protein